MQGQDVALDLSVSESLANIPQLISGKSCGGNMKTYYVYVLCDPSKVGEFVYQGYSFSCLPFYVGKGTNARWRMHMWPSQLKRKKGGVNHIKNGKIKKLLANNIEPFPVFLYSGEDENEAFRIEIDAIAKIGKRINKEGPLTNINDGGKGLSHQDAKIQAINRKQVKSFLGKKHSQETRDRISKVLREKKSIPWNKGKGEYLSAEKRAKVTEAARKALFVREISPDTRKKLIHSKLGGNNPNSCFWKVIDKQKKVVWILRGGLLRFLKEKELPVSLKKYKENKKIKIEKITEDQYIYSKKSPGIIVWGD